MEAGESRAAATLRRRGQLRVYLGAAAGVGTTYAMLDEAIRRAARGASVMVGCVHTRGRRFTDERLHALIGDTPAVSTLDVDAVLARRPDVVLVDELARRNPKGSGREYRWQDVEVLLDNGIDVITTLCVQNIDSLADTVRDIVGRLSDDLVPDDFLSTTDQIEVIDISPAAIRRRMAHGNVFGRDGNATADTELFEGAGFARLRALMMFWMADRLAAAPDDPRGAREKVVVAVTDSPTSNDVIRRAARLAHRSRAALVGVHVVTSDNHPSTAPQVADRNRRLVERLGGTFAQIRGDDVASALTTFAQAEGATQIVLGHSRTARWRELFRSDITRQVLRRPQGVDVHVVSTPASHDDDRRRYSHLVPRQSQIVITSLGLIGLALVTVVLINSRGQLSIATALSIYLLAVVGITALGGPWPGFIAAVVAPLLANWYLIPPYQTFRIDNGENLLELGVFVSVAGIVSWFVTVSARRASEAQRAEREATALASITALGEVELPQVIVEQMRRTFHLDGVAVLSAGGAHNDAPASTGSAPAGTDDADIVLPLAGGYIVVASGPPISADDHRIMRAFLGQLSRALEQQHLRVIAAEADALTRADELRNAMLRAVSHDLRSPLASIKASVSSLRQTDVDWPARTRDEFLESIESGTDHLTTIVTNLLDMSRLEAGVLRPLVRPVALEEVVPGSLVVLGNRAENVILDLATDLPEVLADPALLERVVANLADNALQWSPPDAPVRIRALRQDDTVLLQVIDHGPGIPTSQRAEALQPFNRLDDSATGGGLGLGLAIADRLVAAMGGSLVLRDTPGGGLTVVLALPTPPNSSSVADPR